MFEVTEVWRAACPAAHAGFLVMGDVENPARHPGLETQKQALEGRLRAQFAGQDRHTIETFGPIPAYTAYYKQFDKTYHVLAQLASLAFGKSHRTPYDRLAGSEVLMQVLQQGQPAHEGTVAL